MFALPANLKFEISNLKFAPPRLPPTDHRRTVPRPPTPRLIGYSSMSTLELKRTAENLTAEERVYLAAYLKHLARVDTPAYQAELTRLNNEIDTGKKFTLAQVQRLHEALQAEGL